MGEAIQWKERKVSIFLAAPGLNVQSEPALELPENRSRWTTLPQMPKHIWYSSCTSWVWTQKGFNLNLIWWYWMNFPYIFFFHVYIIFVSLGILRIGCVRFLGSWVRSVQVAPTPERTPVSLACSPRASRLACSARRRSKVSSSPSSSALPVEKTSCRWSLTWGSEMTAEMNSERIRTQSWVHFFASRIAAANSLASSPEPGPLESSAEWNIRTIRR